MLASPRSLSQLTAPFVAIPSQSHPPYGVVVSDDFNIPGGCLREPYAWHHRGGRSRKRLPPPLALRIRLSIGRCIIKWALLLRYVDSFAVRTNLPTSYTLRR